MVMEQDLDFPAARDRSVHDAGHIPRRPSVCLITSLAIADFIDPELTAEATRRVMPGNVGILTIVAELREQGYEPDVVNLDRLFLEFRRRRGTETPAPNGGADDVQSQDEPEHLFSFVMQRLRLLHHDIFGFSTICSSYPLTLRLAEQVKRLNPDALVVLGGPQASVADVSTLEAFDFVDFVVRGEADRTFPALLDVLSGVDRTTTLEDISGITFRRRGEVVRNPNAAVVQDLDTLPMPAFDLDEDIRNRGSVYLEIGRGCPFACTFCSTNDFFRRRFRLRSAQRTMLDMAQIRQAHGIRSFSFIHDMYTVDRRRVVEFCEALLASGEKVTWACSARTDCVDDELIELMARAGCRGIFFGIETGSDRLQKVIKKRLDL